MGTDSIFESLPAHDEPLPRIGDNLTKLYNNVPPSPFRPHSVLKPIPLTPSDMKKLHPMPNFVSSPRGHPSKTQTSYSRFFDHPIGSTSFNDLTVHLQGRARMDRGAGNILGSFLTKETPEEAAAHSSAIAAAAAIPHPPTGRSTFSRSDVDCITPPPKPPKSYAERMIAQTGLEEKLLLERMSARKMRLDAISSGRSVPVAIDPSALRNRFMQPETSPRPSPRRRVIL